MTRVYDLDGENRRLTDEAADDVFVAAAMHASLKEAVFVVAATGHGDLLATLRARGIDAIEDEVLDEYDTALIVTGAVEEWPELRKEIA